MTPRDRLHRHLATWLGRWPGTAPIDVVGSVARERGGWDGRVFPVIGVRSPDAGVLSVPPDAAAIVSVAARESYPVEGSTVDVAESWDRLIPLLPELLGGADRRVYAGVFRWCEEPAQLPDAGVWMDATDPWLPEWLKPFGHEVLVARDPDTGAYLAGVGIKHHDPYGQEIAVGTEPHAQGRGLARALVTQAARRILDEGAVPTYQHDPANVASARVADAAGFPDRGWRSAGVA
jgi:GNAT superfamily N-acetyltransferase